MVASDTKVNNDLKANLYSLLSPFTESVKRGISLCLEISNTFFVLVSVNYIWGVSSASIIICKESVRRAITLCLSTFSAIVLFLIIWMDDMFQLTENINVVFIWNWDEIERSKYTEVYFSFAFGKSTRLWHFLKRIFQKHG